MGRRSSTGVPGIEQITKGRFAGRYRLHVSIRDAAGRVVEVYRMQPAGASLASAAAALEVLRGGVACGAIRSPGRVMAAWWDNEPARARETIRAPGRKGWPAGCTACVYRLYCGSTIVYVGQSVHIRSRLRKHDRERPPEAFDGFKVETFKGPGAAEAADKREVELIRQWHPALNAAGIVRPIGRQRGGRTGGHPERYALASLCG